MTKKLSLLFFICVLRALSINAEVYEGSCGDNVKYSLDTETGLLSITGTGAMTDFKPSLNGNQVTVPTPWFNNNSCIKSVEIANGVTSIGNCAFFECSSLKNIEIPNSMTSIGYGAFYGCSGLTSVDIPNSVTSIGGSAFGKCSGLTSIIIPDGVTSIGSDAFYGCSCLTSIEIPNSVTTIGASAFYGCSGLTSIEIPNSVTSIGGSAFYGCSGLTSIKILDGVKSIEENAFYGCSSLTSVNIPNSVTSIGKKSFYGCSGLTSIEIPNSVTSIGESVCLECPNLTKVTLDCNRLFLTDNYSNSEYYSLKNRFGSQVKEYIIGEDIKTIGQCVFYNCSNLTSVTIPNSVTSIGNYAFYGCSCLTSIEIPNSVTTIGASAFYGCSGLTSIEIPNSVTSIGRSAFSNCSNLTKVIIKCDNVHTELTNVFGNQVKEVIVGSDVKSIGKNAFNQCTALTSVTIGSDVETIDDYAFANIPKLENIFCYAKEVPKTTRTSFENSYFDYITLYVPSASIETYKTTSPWRSASKILKLEDFKEKCATPTINFENGGLSFSCETEGVKYVYNFSTPSESYEEGAAVSMPNKLQVSVYAKKDGFENSDVATKEIDLGTSGIRGDVNNDGVVSMPDAMFIVNKILNGKFPDEEDNGSKPEVRFGFYETIPGFSVKIDKVNMDGVSPYVMGSNAVGTNLNTTASQPTWDKANGSYSFVDLANSNDMFVRIDYTLTADDGSGETIAVKDAIVTIPSQYIQWMPNYKYTYIVKMYDNSNAFNWGETPVFNIFPAIFDAIVIEDDNGNSTVTNITTR